MPETKTVNLPNALYARAQAAYADAGFKTVDEYVAFVLEQVLQSTEPKGGASPDEDEKVKKRLRALGYLD